jgi:hypothetical protein
MKSDRETIEWMLRFAQLDLDSLRAGDWLNLREDLQILLGWTDTPEHTQQLTPENIIAIQAEVMRVLGDVARANILLRKPVGSTPQPTQEPRPWRRSALHSSAHVFTVAQGEQTVVRGLELEVSTVRLLSFDYPGPGSLWLRIEAGLRDTLLFALGITLSRVNITYLRQCPACSRLFFAEHGRQIFCTPQCASREGTRRFRAKQETTKTKKGGRSMRSR